MHTVILGFLLLAAAPDAAAGDQAADAPPPLPPPRGAPAVQAPADDPSLPPLPMPREPLPVEPAPETPAPSPSGASGPPASTPSPKPAVGASAPSPGGAAGLPASGPSAQPLASPVIVPPRGTASYAGKLAFADGVAWAVVLVGLKANSAGPLIAGVASLAVAAPIVHAANGHRGRAWGSWGLRMGGVLLGGVGLGGLDGAVVGFVAAEVIDILALGGLAAKRPPRGNGTFAVTPVLAPTRGGGLLGVAAVF